MADPRLKLSIVIIILSISDLWTLQLLFLLNIINNAQNNFFWILGWILGCLTGIAPHLPELIPFLINSLSDKRVITTFLLLLDCSLCIQMTCTCIQLRTRLKWISVKSHNYEPQGPHGLSLSWFLYNEATLSIDSFGGGAGHEIAPNTVANATKIIMLATKIIVLVTKIQKLVAKLATRTLWVLNILPWCFLQLNKALK